jgi:transposase
MAEGLAITRDEHTAAELRRAAARSRDSDAARRMLALALVKEGASRTEAAQSCGMDRQTLRDWVHRYNNAGLTGLSDKKGRTGPKPRLSPEQQSEIAEMVRKGPDLRKDGIVRWRRVDLVRVIQARFNVTLAERTVGGLLRRLGFSHVSARPRHPQADAAAQASFAARSAPS